MERRRKAQQANSRQYEDFCLDNIGHEYAEIKTRGESIREVKSQDPLREQANVYYNLSSTSDEETTTVRQETYYNSSSTSSQTATAISVSKFQNFVQTKKREEGFFDTEFKNLYTGLQFPATSAMAPGNRSKNRYRNIYPYDDNRVKLKSETGRSDFINTSFIQGFAKDKAYIATQGPLEETIEDFWWMVWNEKSENIVMLSNTFEDDKEECVQYWPEKDEMTVGNLTIEVMDIEYFGDFVLRTFYLKNSKEKRIIRQFQFTAWTNNIPACASSLVQFHSKVKQTAGYGEGSLVVHCSAGIGRTGSFIALDILTHQAKESGFVDVFGCVEYLRRQRVNMVQTLEQYVLIYDALREALIRTSLELSTLEFPHIYKDLLTVDPESSMRYIDKYFEDIGAKSAIPPESAYSWARDSANKEKNRYKKILPIDSEIPEVRDENNRTIYINAVFLPAHNKKRYFIVTQMPLKQTVEEFWRLLIDQKISTVVMLNEIEPNKSSGMENIGKYWPELKKTMVFGIVQVTAQNLETKEPEYKIMDLLCSPLQGENKNVNRKLRIFMCNFWADSATIPDSVSKFLKFIHAVELHNKKNSTGSILVHCMNGAGKCGLYCVLQVVLQKMKEEHDVAIHQVIQQMRSIRPSIIPNTEQLKFCYDAVMEYLNKSDVYSNFHY